MPSTRKPLTEISRCLRRDVTDAEKRLWRFLRDEPFKPFHFRRQAPIGRFVVDLASHSAKLVVELYGGQHAEQREAARDETRAARLEAGGYRVLRFWNSAVFDDGDGVVDTIFRALYHPSQSGARAAATPAPNPFPQGGGE